MEKEEKLPKNTLKSARNNVLILKIGINSTPRTELLSAILTKTENEARLLVVTPNPEIIVQAQSDPELVEILNKADFAVPDGVGIAWAARFLHGRRVEVMPGRLLFASLVQESAKRGWRVFLLGGEEGVAPRAARAITINSKYKIANIKYDSGPWLNERGEPVDAKQRRVEQQVIAKINKFRPHFLFVGFGAPKQEKWLGRNLPRLKIGAGMTVGGTFDYYAGKVPLPPDFVAKLGLEWLWRLLTQPGRAARIFTATVIFPLQVLRSKLTQS